MNQNKYVSNFDRKVNSMIAQYEKGEVSEKVLQIALGILFSKYFTTKILRNISFEDQNIRRSMGISLKKVTEYYNGNI